MKVAPAFRPGPEDVTRGQTRYADLRVLFALFADRVGRLAVHRVVGEGEQRGGPGQRLEVREALGQLEGAQPVDAGPCTGPHEPQSALGMDIVAKVL